MKKLSKITAVVLIGIILCTYLFQTEQIRNYVSKKEYNSNTTMSSSKTTFDIIWSTNSSETRKTIVHYYDITNNKEIDGSTNWVVPAIGGQKVTLKNRRALTPENELKYDYVEAKVDSISGETIEEISYDPENGWYYYKTTNSTATTWKTTDVSEVHVYLLYEENIETNDLETVETADTSDYINIMAFDYSFKYKDGYVEGINTFNNQQRPFLVAGSGEGNVWYNTWSGNWTTDMINSHKTTYNGSKEFIAKDIIKNTLKNDYPVLTAETGFEDESLDYLFNEEEVEGKLVYGGNTTDTTLNHLFTKDEQGYYSYDSTKNYASLVSNRTDSNNFIVYNAVSRNKAKFMPFNDLSADSWLIGKGVNGWDENYSQYYSGYTEGIGNGNFAFGLKLEFEFIQSENGKDKNNNDEIIQINSDDCVWVFIDDVLVLDQGGIHGETTGIINLSTGEITEDNVTSTISEKLNAASKDIELTSTGTFQNNTQHHVKIYLLERGGYESIFGIKFNLELAEITEYKAEAKKEGEGTVKLSKEKALEGEIVEIDATPSEGYVLSAIKVTDEKGNIIEVTGKTFIMPASNVKVEVIFEKVEVKNPNTTGKLAAIIFIGFIISILISLKYFKKIR